MQEWQQWLVPSALGALVALALVLVVALLRLRARTRRELAVAHAEAAALRAQVEEIERKLAAPVPAPAPETAGYVITALGEEPRHVGVPVEPVDSALFADLVLRETLVKAASLAHGVRRALAPQTRNRIRFEVRREIKRSRKQRRADLKEARRDWEGRQRSEISLTDGEDAA